MAPRCTTRTPLPLYGNRGGCWKAASSSPGALQLASESPRIPTPALMTAAVAADAGAGLDDRSRSSHRRPSMQGLACGWTLAAAAAVGWSKPARSRRRSRIADIDRIDRSIETRACVLCCGGIWTCEFQTGFGRMFGRGAWGSIDPIQALDSTHLDGWDGAMVGREQQQLKAYAR